MKEFRGTKGTWSVVGEDHIHIKSSDQNYPLGQAFVQNNFINNKRVVDVEAIANAKLMCSAPDLLEALLEAIEFLKDVYPEDPAGLDQLAYITARGNLAIKKALNENT